MLCGVAKMDDQQPLIKPGRPRIEVNCEVVLRLRDEQHLGWTRGAEAYREITKQWISRDTFKRRYYDARAEKSPLQRIIEELQLWELKI